MTQNLNTFLITGIQTFCKWIHCFELMRYTSETKLISNIIIMLWFSDAHSLDMKTLKITSKVTNILTFRTLIWRMKRKLIIALKTLILSHFKHLPMLSGRWTFWQLIIYEIAGWPKLTNYKQNSNIWYMSLEKIRLRRSV